MAFDQERRTAILRERAATYVEVALTNITREYPHMPYFIATDAASYRTHRDFHPAFFGCFDWHSCVEMHWAIVRLLRRFPGDVPASRARATLNELLTAENIAAEVAFFGDPNHRTLERPYGWGWFLTLHHELATWDDPDAGGWTQALDPLADLFAANLVAWLPKLTYAQRTGVHPNTAFGLSRSFDFATRRAAHGDPALLNAIDEAAHRWFRADADYPAHYEPSGADFLSAALAEAELMSRILPATDFPAWLSRFLPSLADARPTQLFQPATVTDATDGQIGHLHGLNLSRAAAFVALAERFPAGDPRLASLLVAAERHADAALPFVAGSDYMVEHWLACYAVLLLS